MIIHRRRSHGSHHSKRHLLGAQDRPARRTREVTRCDPRAEKSTRTWRRRTNRVSRGSGRKDHPLRRKPARRSLSKPRELPGLGDSKCSVDAKSDESIEEFTCTAIFMTISAMLLL